jgi:urease accessory protein
MLLLFPALAQAHIVGGPFAGLADGLAHPITGLDHLAAMVAIGLWAAQMGGRAMWLVPAAFAAVMALGGVLGAAGVGLPLVEPAIMASVLLFGLLIAAAIRLPLVTSGLIAGGFALFHGHAHGAELPASASSAVFGAGFLATTIGLLIAGAAAGALMRSPPMQRWVRFAGGAIAVGGLYLCLV